MSSDSEVIVGYIYGASPHTWRLASTAWVIFPPQGQLLSSIGICLGDTTNNVAEYSVVIELLHDALSVWYLSYPGLYRRSTGCVLVKQSISGS
jgi:ribonuclease HI